MMDGSSAQASSSSQTQERENLFVFFFGEKHINFVLSELLAITDYLGLSFTVQPWSTEVEAYKNLKDTAEQALARYRDGFDVAHTHDEQPEWHMPFVCLHVPAGETAVKSICKRSISIKAVYELWGEGETYDAMEKQASQPHRMAMMQPYRNQQTSFKVEFRNFNWSLSDKQRLERIERMKFTDLPGKIMMKGAELSIGLIEFYDPSLDRMTTAQKEEMGPDAFRPDLVFCGRKIDKENGRSLVDQFSVKKRKYIGNTTMESEMSLRMALMAKAGPGKIVFDPFCGTGSMLYTSAAYGAEVVGSDIDVRTLRGKPESRRHPTYVVQTAKSYGIAHHILDCLQMDFTQPAWRDVVYSEGMFDAIITDPPYGVRAGAKKLGRVRNKKGTDEPTVLADGRLAHAQEDYIMPTRPYHLHDLLVDLMNQAARLLKDDGRLVFFVPSMLGEGKRVEIPPHPDLTMVASNAQDFGYWKRVLITMRRKKRQPGQATAKVNAAAFLRSETGFRKADEDSSEFRNLYLLGSRAAQQTLQQEQQGKPSEHKAE